MDIPALRTGKQVSPSGDTLIEPDTAQSDMRVKVSHGENSNPKGNFLDAS